MQHFLRLFLRCALALPTVSLAAATPTIMITPGPATLAVNQTVQFTATVVGLTSTAVTWKVDSFIGGNASLGTISATGLYQAPAKPFINQKATIVAIGSDGKTTGTVLVNVAPVGPKIGMIGPNPIAPGKYSIKLMGSGFGTGAVVRNGLTILPTQFVSATELIATGEQASLQTGSFEVKNPDSAWGPPLQVPFKTRGVAPQVLPKASFVHLGNAEQFNATASTYWTTSAGTITQTGYFIAPSTMPASGTALVTATGPGGSTTVVVTLAAGAEQSISPKTATVAVGGKLQFTSSGAKVWSAVNGSISSTGLYTAPAVWPAGGTDEILVSGLHGQATANLVITPAAPEITSVSNGGHVPLGQFTLTVYGKNFSPASWVEMFGASLPTNYYQGTLRVTGFFGRPGPTTLTVNNHTLTSNAFPIQIGIVKPKASPAAARRFLEQAGFGPTPNDAETVQQLGLHEWLDWQLNMAQVSNYKGVKAAYGGMPQQFMTNAVMQPDQLRQRVAFALSQIFVTSLNELSNANMIPYQDMLLVDAFTNYQKIMTDVTLSPGMGQYLNIANNAKADPVAGSLANENFAREMMQLFTLGTSLLNDDGTVQLDSNGLPIPTYSQFTVTEFARVYTGWTYAPASGKSPQWNAGINNYGPMVPIADQHDSGSKQLLSGFVSPAGITPRADLTNAIKNVFTHPNIAPFVSTLLIQHLVKSNPSPAYVGRVAAVFKNNGAGVRGDMKAVIAAILLDAEARANDEGGDDHATDGHLQEPALYIAGVVRAFGGQMNDQNYYQWELQNMSEDLFSSPSVFNYFAPNYGVPGTNLLGGEFQIYSPNNAVVRANQISVLFNQWSNPVQTFGPGTTVNLAPFLYLAPDPPHLVAALDLTLTHGTMPAEMRQIITTAVAGEDGGNLRRVEKACYLILTSSYYNVWH